ncbi:hypothetical protein TSUD_253980 [Trifolium subterraneum]|uniref:Uncharacterized protein n=1 Tax=Trifolium subterraneum TaxID=3900 RepID=A0A2Z6P9K4_TRISU|nr:hypothetical protein TSUD_253980 [Trifolium subterraneum]
MHLDHDGSHDAPVWPFMVAFIITAVFLRACHPQIVAWWHSPAVAPAPEIEM